MKRLFAYLILVVGLAAALPATAADLVVSRAALEDKAATLTISDVVGRDFVPVGATLSRGVSNSAFWIRLRVQAPAEGSRVVLFIRQPFLNEIRLYEADAGDPRSWRTRVTGNYYPYGERDRARNSLGFIVNVPPSGATFYLRLKTRSASQLSVSALTPDEADRQDTRFDLMEVIFVTAMLLLFLWAAQSYLLDRQPVVGLFALHQAMYTLFGVAITGYLAPFIPAGFPRLAEWSTAGPYCAVSFTTLLFCRALFKPYEPPPLLMRGLDLFLLVFPLELAAMALGYTPATMVVNAILIRISWWYFIVMAFTLRKEHAPSRRVLQLVFVTVTLVFTVFWFTSRSSQAGTNINIGRQVLIVNGMFIGCLFAMVLNARLRRLLQEAQQSAMELILTQKTLELERTLKEEAELQARTDYLTGMFNRRHFIELADHELARALRYRRPLSLLMIDIDRFKTVNDTWGHSTGDTVLQEVSLLIREAMRDADIVGRMGGEEFAALLVETDTEQAMQVAQRLCAAVADAVIVSPQDVPVQVTISLGLAGLKGRNINFDRLLHEADMALYRAKQEGRNRIAYSD
ncbi:diguanylate cyclase [Geobacter sp. AOG2]|uniref:diguanylate cyclase n=1 Tax=Geobacter sp. AOG2 TaxID=1566347 RepID=UPI001CC7CDB2|nr:diguanylate cyclase [Geobacter sp. AOG2]